MSLPISIRESSRLSICLSKMIGYGLVVSSFSFALSIIGSSLSTVHAQRPSLVYVDTVLTKPLVQTVDVIGRIVAAQAGVVSGRIQGTIVEMPISIGSRVEKGDVIARIDPESIAARLDVARSDVSRAQATVAVRNASLDLARLERKRYQQLMQTATTARAQFEKAQSEEAIEAARLKEASAAQQSTAASLRLAELNFQYATVRAPYAGVVTQRLTEVGSYLKVGDDVVSLVADTNLEVEANVPFNRLSGVTGDARFIVVLDDESEHPARLRAIIPTEDSRTRTRPVRFLVSFDWSTNALAVGQTATVRIPIGKAREVLAVHKDAVVRRGAKSVVYIVENDQAQLRPVTLGEAVGEHFEVLSGVNEGDIIVVRGNERLRPNTPVKIAESK